MKHIILLGLLPSLITSALAQTQPTLTVGNATIQTGGNGVVSVTLNNQGASIAGLQFDLLYGQTTLTVTVHDGGATIAANKSAATNPVSGGKRVMIAGLNQGLFGNGDVADLSLTVAANGNPGTYPLTIVNVSASDMNGRPISIQGSGGSVVVTSGE